MAFNDSIASIGTKLFKWNDTANQYECIAQVMSISWPSSNRDSVETTMLDSERKSEAN